jgi:hypothetical protein
LRKYGAEKAWDRRNAALERDTAELGQQVDRIFDSVQI